MKKKIITMGLSCSLLFGAFAFPFTASAGNAETATIVYGVNFRENPSPSGEKIRMLKKGETVRVLAHVGKNWLKVEDKNGRIGYISSSAKYVDFDNTSASKTNASNTTKPSTTSPATTGNAQPSASGGQAYNSAAASEKAKLVIAAGMKYLGTPYEFGSDRSTTTTFDCSDFVRQAFKDALGIVLPADSRKQGAYVKEKGQITTDWRQLKPGDLMFFMSYRGSKPSSYSGIDKMSQRITHVGIYLGDGKILHTYSKESGGVRVDSIVGKHWEYRFIFGGSAI